MSIRDDLDDLLDGRTTWTAFIAGRGFDADEAALIRGCLRRGGIRGIEHVADARAARRAAEIRSSAATDLPRTLGLPQGTLVLSSDDYEAPLDLTDAIDDAKEGRSDFIVLLVTTGQLRHYTRADDEWIVHRHRLGDE